MTLFLPTQDIENIATDLQTIVVGNLGFDANLVFVDEPDGPPPDGSVLILLRQFDVTDNTNGKLAVKLTFAVLYLLNPNVNRNTRKTLNSYTIPFILAFEAWFNQTLNNDYERIDAKKGGIGRVPYGDQAYDALTTFIDVTTEFNIPMS